MSENALIVIEIKRNGRIKGDIAGINKAKRKEQSARSRVAHVTLLPGRHKQSGSGMDSFSISDAVYKTMHCFFLFSLVIYKSDKLESTA